MPYNDIHLTVQFTTEELLPVALLNRGAQSQLFPKVLLGSA